ncbi:MAG: hypothetical protein VYD89_01185, partial [Candidatus Thermoplasmatota archaeon]|nr:hypothetical protein [Candidatus Thermoplasmatota archaeon]
AIGVVWISCWPSKPVTRVRILYRPPERNLTSVRIFLDPDPLQLTHGEKWAPRSGLVMGVMNP